MEKIYVNATSYGAALNRYQYPDIVGIDISNIINMIYTLIINGVTNGSDDSYIFASVEAQLKGLVPLGSAFPWILFHTMHLFPLSELISEIRSILAQNQIVMYTRCDESPGNASYLYQFTVIKNNNA